MQDKYINRDFMPAIQRREQAAKLAAKQAEEIGDMTVGKFIFSLLVGCATIYVFLCVALSF